MEEGLTTFLFCSISLLSILATSTAVLDTIAANQTIKDGETIVSASETFELGFFSPSNSSQNRYLGIWYKKLATGTVVWVANSETPLPNKSGVLTLDPRGILVLQNATRGIIWSSSSSDSVRNPVARLLDTGNLVMRDESDSNPENFIWQSFNHPGNTFLAGMKFGKDFTNFTSWKSDDDPSTGDHMVYMDFGGYPQVFQKKGSAIQHRLGSWNGLRFTGMPSLKPNPYYTYEFVLNEKEVYYKFELKQTSVITNMFLTSDGHMNRLYWIDRTRGWFLYSTPPRDSCARYALCGSYGSCDINTSPACGCLAGFNPKVPEDWNVGDWTRGCQRKVDLDCGSGSGSGDGFLMYSALKLPDTRWSRFNQSMSLAECAMVCKNNCSCTAYTTLNISDGSGCLLWFGDLIDMRALAENGQDIYIRMGASELEKDGSSIKKRRVKIIVIPVMVLVTLTIILGLCLLYVYKRRKQKRKGKMGQDSEEVYPYPYESQKNDLDLPLFSLSTLLGATNHFSFNNKLGEGGFGPVYKGMLEDGREIAVKRLSETSTQGLEEFKNEVICISKLQHRNLVKLLGCCIQGKEKLLIYEFMPNRSLDSFIFDDTRNKILDWPKCFHIINGIARGLLYLHQDSRLRIIHRDLKAGNILLDFDMNPKISDFGMARSFGANESETNTKRVVGTYGYMSPEYAGDGIFSVKSDVYSFGVLVLEIVSGKRNRGFSHQDHLDNLLGHAWRFHKEGKSLELVDATVINSCHVIEVLRSIHVGLLCVQQCPEDRPNMSSVILMLSSKGGLPEPKQPGFFTESSKFGLENSSSMQAQSSTNELSIKL